MDSDDLNDLAQKYWSKIFNYCREKGFNHFLFIKIKVKPSPLKTNHTVTCWFFDKIVVNWSISINWGDDEKMAELDRILNPFVNYIIQFLEEYGIFMDCLYDY